MKKGLSMRARHNLEGWSFVLLWAVGFLLFMAIPLARSLIYSFQDLKVSTEGLIPTNVGLKHFRHAFVLDVDFVPNLITTFMSIIVEVPLILIFAIFISMLLNRNFIGRSLFRGIFFLPVIITSGAVLQKLKDNGAETLPIFSQYNLFVKLVEFIPRDILFPMLGILDSLTVVMWDSGVQILIFLAGLQAISVSLYEAAKCDGATPWESFWKITFPMLIPMIFVNVLFSIMNSFTKADNLVMEQIKTVFKASNYGYASALGWIYFVLTFVLIGIVVFIFRRSLGERG